MKKLLLVLLASVSLAGISAANAGEDPCCNKDNVTSIRWIKSVQNNLDDDDRYVVLVGKITKKYKDETYFFTDGTGTIQLDSEAELPVGKTIVVRGKIDQAFLHIGELEVEVCSWRYVK